MLSIVSCQKWAPIIVDREELTFGKDGGYQVVTITKNYDVWFIGNIRDAVSGENFLPNENEYMVNAEGISAIVDRNTLTITVASSDLFHKWCIEMWSGDAYKTIVVQQNIDQ